MKTLFKRCSLMLLATLPLLLQAAEEKKLNVYNWADYIGPDTIADFENEFGIKVNYDLYDSTEVVEAKLLAGRTGYDLVMHAARYSARLIPIGVYQPLQDEPTDVIPMVMQYLGHDPNSLEPEHLEEVESVLKSVRLYIRYFSSTKMINDLPNREVCVAMSWSGDYAQAMARSSEVGAKVELAYYTPEEGTVYWFDGVYITSDAPHPDNAHLFLNYPLRPEVMAAISNETRYANTNLASKPFINPVVVSDPATYPADEERQRAAIGYIFGPKEERRRTRSWSRVKTGL